jgi:alpha-L-arabinofuranosidase
LSGDEGFLIPFLVQDEETKAWWNIGGWGNTQHAIEMDGIVGNGVPGKIETGRWYDIRIELNETAIKCYLDGKLIHDISYPSIKALYGVASRTRDGHEVILKVVNASDLPQETDIRVNGTRLGPTASVITLSSESSQDENSLDQPSKVAPVTRELACSGSDLKLSFAGNSVTVLRIKVQ